MKTLVLSARGLSPQKSRPSALLPARLHQAQMDLATRLPSFAKILVLPQFCFSPAHSDLALTKAQRPALGAPGRGHHCPLRRGETEARRNKQAGRAACRGEHEEPPRALPCWVCLSRGPFLLLPPSGLAAMLQSRPAGCVSGAVLTHQPPVSSQVTQLFLISCFRAHCLPRCAGAADGASPWPFCRSTWPLSRLAASTGARRCLMSKGIRDPDVPMEGG